MMDPRIDIGIDGGGTGCRVVASVDGREAHGTGGARTSRATGGPANVVTDPAGAEAALRGALLDALGALGLGLRDMGEARIVAGLAGCRLPGVAEAFAMRLPYLAYVVDDSVTALEGAFAGKDGTLVNLGTGSFFIRRDGRGITHHGGWGFRLSDEGSAAWLGRRALQEVVQIADGRLARFSGDPLVAELEDACGAHPVIFARDAGPEAFAALAAVIGAATSPWARALQAQVVAVLREGLDAIGHPAGGTWVLEGGLGRALAGRLDGPVWAGRREAEGTSLEGALAMARALP